MRARDALIAGAVLLIVVVALLLQRCGKAAPAPAAPPAPVPEKPAVPAAKPKKGKPKEPPAVFITLSTHDGPRSWTVVSRKLGCAGDFGRPPAACARAPLVRRPSASCRGSGLVGCMPDAYAEGGSCTFAGDWVQLFCVRGQTVPCLDDETCPWRKADAVLPHAIVNGPDSEVALCFHHQLVGGESRIGSWTLNGDAYVWWGLYGVGSVPDDASERCSVLIDTPKDLLQARK